jgi:hypothetical protein
MAQLELKQVISMALAAAKEVATTEVLVIIMELAAGLVPIEMETIIKGLVTIMVQAFVVQARVMVTFQELVEVLLLWHSCRFCFHLLILANRQ